MCEDEKQLIAWLDGELPTREEAARLEAHLRGCAQCRGQLRRFRKISQSLDGYCDAALAAEAKRGRPAWTTAAVSAGVAAAAVAVVFLLFLRQPRKPAAEFPEALAAPSAEPVATAAVATIRVETPVPARHRQPKKNRPGPVLSPEPVPEPAAPQQAQAGSWQPPERMIEVAIPADSMFAPGAVPDGVAFIADVSIEPNGSVGQFRFGP